MKELDRICRVALEVLKPYGLKRAALFGSAARNEEVADSDIDLLVAFEKPLGLFTLARVQRELSQKLGRKLDLVTEGAMSPYIRPFVEKEKRAIYER